MARHIGASADKRKPRVVSQFEMVQLHPRSQDAEDVAGNGGGRIADALVNGRYLREDGRGSTKGGTARTVQNESRRLMSIQDSTGRAA